MSRPHPHGWSAGGIVVLLACWVQAAEPQLMTLGPAWAANSINAVIFRSDPITTHGNRQYAAYYNAEGRVVIAAREISQTEWTNTVTDFRGNIKDAHNSISIMADGAGFLHVAWDHHDNPLRYVRSKQAGSLEFTQPMPMTGTTEEKVSYPQFYRLPDGNLLFFYRAGHSGRGNLVLNHYDAKAQSWKRLHDNLISGEGARNAYWQVAVDGKGAIHLSWVWRESPDVASNHDMCYARSQDGGKTWERADGTTYTLPVTQASAEVALRIPQKRELINQTSICADEAGQPIIATYFREGDVVQYQLIYRDGGRWKSTPVTSRKSRFSLSGGGSKQIPISRPQVLAATRGGSTAVWMLFRDIERGSKVSVAFCPDLSKPKWTITDLTSFSVRSWEPSLDRIRWERDGVLNLYVQTVGQGDGETLEDVPPQPAQVLEWKP
jgi:hypothetical protein